MLLLFLGMVQLTALLSVKHKLSSAASVMADLVTRHSDLITQADLNEYFRAVELVMGEAAQPGAGVREVRTRVFAYRFDRGRFILVWSWQNHAADGGDLGCSNPVAADIKPLALNADGTTQGIRSDLIVAVTCTRFTFPVPSIPYFTPFADPAINLRQQIIMRPRAYLQINCVDCPTS